MTVSFVTATRYLGPVGKGVSGSQFFDCDDNNEYLVKFFDRRKTIINELVGGCLAMRIGLPTPKVSLVQITHDLINLSDGLKTRKVESGLHVGSRLQNITDFDKITLQTLDDYTLVNHQDLYGVVCFDTWLLNGDRDNRGNNMIEFLSNDRIRYWMVDFSHCFTGSDWTESSLAIEKHSLGLMPMFNDLFQKYLTDKRNFNDWFDRLDTVLDAEIQDIIDTIPVQWSLHPGERSEILDTIKLRRGLVRIIINGNVGI